MDFTHNNTLRYYLGTNQYAKQLFFNSAPLLNHFLFVFTSGSLGLFSGFLTTQTGRGVSIADFLCLNQRMDTLSAVLSSFKDNNPAWTKTDTFVIDKDFVEWAVLEELFPKSKSAVVQARESASLSSEEAAISIDIEDRTSNQGFFLNLGAQYRPFTEAFINQVTKFYQLKAILRNHMDDARWLRRDWTVYLTNDTIILFRTIDPDPASMAREVERIYLSSHLKRTFVSGAMHPLGTTNPHVTSTSFDELIGKLARDSFLSDIAVTFSLQNVWLDLHTCFVFEPMRMSRRDSYLPAQHYNHVKLTILPINIENLHWVIEIARLHTTDGRARVALYDPMVTPSTKAPWSSFGSPFSEDINVEMLSTPKQRYGHNFGVLCIAQASCYINKTAYVEQQGSHRVRFRDRKYIKAETLHVLRIRMLWELLCLSSETKTSLVEHKVASHWLRKLFEVYGLTRSDISMCQQRMTSCPVYNTGARLVANVSHNAIRECFAIAFFGSRTIRIHTSSAMLLHEFPIIHAHLHALTYTSFADAIVTLESDRDSDDEIYLCVYHDWREKDLVRGYKLPLGVILHAHPVPLSSLLAVCTVTGRIAVAMNSVINLWQCSDGFFHHILELSIRFAASESSPYIQSIAIHDKHIAVTSPLELLVLQVHFHDRQMPVQSVGDWFFERTETQSEGKNELKDLEKVPEDDIQCVKIRSSEDLRHLCKITVSTRARGRLDPITCLRKVKAVRNTSPGEQKTNRKSDFEEGKNQNVIVVESADQEASLLKGFIKLSDVRMNQNLSYYTTADDIEILLRRYFPRNHSVQKLQFLPETIAYGGVIAVETQRYPRLLITTPQNAFLYYFIRPKDENMRKELSKKVLGKVEDKFTTSLPEHRSSCQTSTPRVFSSKKDSSKSVTQLSHHVLVEYEFPLPVISIAANSSFMFVATSMGMQVWTIWNPCHYLAARHALAGWRESWLLQPSAPQLLCVQSLPFKSVQIVALDCHVVIVPANAAHEYPSLRLENSEANFRLREDDFEVSKREVKPSCLQNTDWGISMDDTSRILILQQAPPSLLFSKLLQLFEVPKDDQESPFHDQSLIDLTLSFFSSYRFRANVGLSVLKCLKVEKCAEKTRDAKMLASDRLALELETNIYDSLARKCAQVLANAFTKHPAAGDIARAIPLYIASNVPPTEVLNRLEGLQTPDNFAQVSRAIKKYLKALAFPSHGNTLEADSQLTQSPDDFQEQGSDGVMQSVLRYFGKYAPEQLARLVIDAALTWTCNDLELALEQLSIEPNQTHMVQSAFLVLLLHGHSFRDKVDAKRFPYLMKYCSYDTICNRVRAMLKESPHQLIQICVTHPELLAVPRDSSMMTTSSLMSQALLQLDPHILLVALEKAFLKMLENMHNTVFSAFLHCLGAIGPPASACMVRMCSYYSEQSLSGYKDDSREFSSSDRILLRIIWQFVQSIPKLDKKADHGELLGNDEDWKRTKATLALEYIHLVTQLSKTIADKQKSQVYIELFSFFEDICSVQAIKEVEVNLSEWIPNYLRAHCLEIEGVHDRPLLRMLYAKLLFILTSWPLILDYHSVVECHGNGRNGLETLIALVCYPKVHRTPEALELLTSENTWKAFLLPYANNYCTRLEDWRYLINMLTAKMMGGNEHSGKEDDQQQILHEILGDLADTLSPTELILTMNKGNKDDDVSLTSTSTMNSEKSEWVSLLKNSLTQQQWARESLSSHITKYLNALSPDNHKLICWDFIDMASRWKRIGYNPYQPDAQGYTTLHRAAEAGDAAILCNLLAMYDGPQHQIAAVKTKEHEFTSLHLAAKYGHYDAVKVLTQPALCSLINKTDRNGNTALLFAAACRAPESYDIVATLLSLGVDHTIRNHFKITSILAHILMLRYDDPKIIAILLHYGCDPNTQDSNGDTILHHAIRKQLWKVSATLVHHGASMTIANDEGEMVLSILGSKQFDWLIQFVSKPVEWVPVTMQNSCMLCSTRFSFLVRPHHCRLCGRICCGPCSNNRRRLPFQLQKTADTSLSIVRRYSFITKLAEGRKNISNQTDRSSTAGRKSSVNRGRKSLKTLHRVCSYWYFHIHLTMPREIITLQIGQCGNQIGRQFWHSVLAEHANLPKAQYSDSMSTFFRNVDRRTGRDVCNTREIQALKARAILIDMEEGPVSETLNGPLGALFDQQQIITDVSGAGNNWAHGYCVYGPQYHELLLTKLHQAVESCDSLQSFFLLHSMGGGTGSGLGTYILQLLEDEFPQVYRFTTAIFPSRDDDVITSPYNSIMALEKLIEHADCVLPVENEALHNMCAKMETGKTADQKIVEGSRISGNIQSIQSLRKFYQLSLKVEQGAKKKANDASQKKTKQDSFHEMNNVVARMLSNLTSSMRFEGPLNVDLSEITTNLVPYPKLHFLLPSISPCYRPIDLHDAHHPKNMEKLFRQLFESDSQLLCCSPRSSVYLACGILARGRNVTISDLNDSIQHIQRDISIIPWNQEGFKIGVCHVSLTGQPVSLLGLSNNCSIGQTFKRMYLRTQTFYKRKAHLHHYTEFMESSLVDNALDTVFNAVQDYQALESGRPYAGSGYNCFSSKPLRPLVSSSRPTRLFFYSLSLCAFLLCNNPTENHVASFQIDFDQFSHMFDMDDDSHQVAHEEPELQEDFYEVLGLTMEASEAQIKKAYRKLSLKYHPDKQKDEKDAEKMFHKIARAYEVLSDPDKRQIYDLEGFEGLKREEQGGGKQQSPFDMLFGGQRSTPRGPDATIGLKVTLEELYQGTKKSATIQRNVICRKCRGTGAKDGKMKPCKKCGGRGVIHVQQRMGLGFNVQVQQPCPKCGGQGKTFKKKCPHCHGHKVTAEEKDFVVDIERGAPSNHQIVFERQSEQKPGMLPGNVIFQLQTKPHAAFRRSEDDLHHTMEISLQEALLGYDVSVVHLDGRKVHLAYDKIIKPFEVRTIEGEGMPHFNYPSDFGNLHIHHHIKFPKSLTPEQKELVNKLLAEHFPS
uniref:Uncharacterized protein AlNc14C16G1776 n=1 Tax=Albugo laibachii Nc14 TaxID=890382 RepID=F0W4A4_9STRA|nr:conserved hypothetical protein [Albugo laibachii Nc14]|eukprot:CCA15933.1 conserved hypothetical protein [Albugo laibachii Nc14]